MIKIPNRGKFSQPNNSDLFGNIHYTKGVNFDEEGYVKSSSRTVSLLNSVDDANFNIPVSFGRHSAGSFYIATTDTPYKLSLGDGVSSLAADNDTGNPSLDFTSRGKWWRTLWHVTDDTELYYKTKSSGDWTNTGITNLTAGKAHPIEVFESANTLAVADGNTVRQLDSSYATTNLAQLTLATDYEVVTLAYNKNTLGIGTRLASTIEGQNTEAKFFTWDGSLSSANDSYGVGSDAIIDVAPYKSSFVILTRAGELLYFNGGGFDKLEAFPPYFKDVVWGEMQNVMGYGDMIQADGDILYINVNSKIKGTNLSTHLENFPGGIWCYDPNIGLYHRYSPSITRATILYSREEDISTATDTATVFNGFSMPLSPTIPATGNPVKILSSAVGGLLAGNIYYMIKVSSTTFKLATTKADADAGTAIDLTSAGTLVCMALDVKDYGQSRINRIGGVALQEDRTHAYDGVIFGGEYYRNDSTNDYEHLNISVAGFKNISYLVTAKITSDQVEDIIPKIYLKYRPLKTDDTIIVKYKNKDYVGLPKTASCTVTSPSEMYTTDDISEAYTRAGQGIELECEVISGAGAGQMVKVNSIAYGGGTYAIELAEALEGVVATSVLSIKLDNWAELQTITTEDSENWKDIPLAKNSKWTKLKVVMSGSDIAIEEILPVNATFLPAK